MVYIIYVLNIAYFSYKAGLDTKEDMTGKESLYTEFNGK